MQAAHYSPDKAPQTPVGAGAAGDAAEPPSEVVSLRHFRAFQDSGVTLYSMEFACGDKYWTMVRRYSEFMQCNVRLLENFSRKELPPFPPKEGLRKVFGGKKSGRPNGWNEDRKVLLYEYLSDLIEQPHFLRYPALQRLIGIAPEDIPENIASPGKAFQPGSPGAAAILTEDTDASPSCQIEADAKRKESDAAAAGATAQQEEETTSQYCEPGRASISKSRSYGVYESRLKHGEEVHQILTFQGRAAATYAKKVEESQREALERAPIRFEKAQDGSAMSVKLRLSTVGQLELEKPFETPRGTAEIDSSRHQQQQELLKRDERQVAEWIHAVTGDPEGEAAAAGTCSLQSVLRSGEVLCDLVNAIWPGKIVGIRRGETISSSPRSSRRRLANITHFVQACGQLGVEEANMPLPSDLAEGKSSRKAVRCLFALGALAPGPPEFDGPRLSEPSARVLPLSRAGSGPLAGCDEGLGEQACALSAR